MWLFFSALAVLTALALLVYNVRLKPVKDEKR
jgi:hypothetical protein